MYINNNKLSIILDMFLNCKITHLYSIFVSDSINKREINNFLKQQLQNENVEFQQANNRILNLKTKAILKIIVLNQYNCLGYRSSFGIYDDIYPKDIVDTILKPACSIIIPFNVKESLRTEIEENKCNRCICKTCAFAEVNGGAPGCGNCKNCKLEKGCRSCNEYYNVEPIFKGGLI